MWVQQFNGVIFIHANKLLYDLDICFTTCPLK